MKNYIILLIFAVSIVLLGKSANAQSTCPPFAPVCGPTATCSQIKKLHEITRCKVKEFIKKDFDDHKKWMEEEFFEKHLLDAFVKLTEQFTDTQMASVTQQSTIADASNLNKNKLAIEKNTLETSVAVNSSAQVCSTVSALEGNRQAEEVSEASTERLASNVTALITGQTGTGETSPAQRSRRQLIERCQAANAGSPFAAACESLGGAHPILDFLTNQTNLVSMEEGEVTEQQQTINTFMGSLFGAIRPVSLTPERAKNVLPAAMELRGNHAQINLASRCFLDTFSETFASEDSQLTETQIASMKQKGLSDEQIEDMGASERVQLFSLISALNSPEFGVGLIDTNENVMRQSNIIEGVRTSFLYNLLEHQHCSEMISAMMLTNQLEGKRRELTDNIRNLDFALKEKQNQVQFAGN